MPLQTRYFPNRVCASVFTAVPDMVRFLIDDHPTLTGPGWTIVEAFTSASSAREVPTDPTSISSLTGAVSWVSGTIGTGDWIVLESANGNNTNHFQLYMRVHSSVALQMLLIPLEDFVTGGTATTFPTFPTTSVGSGASVPITMPTLASPQKYSVVADQGMAAFLFDSNVDTSTSWTYVGELNGSRGNGTPADSRCYVIYDLTSTMNQDNGINNTAFRAWNRLSPVDNTTVLSGTTNGGSQVVMGLAGNNGALFPHWTTSRDATLGVDSILPLGVYFGGGIHRHFMGFLRNVFSSHRFLPNACMLNDRNFISRNNNAIGAMNDPGICFRWDGTTLYP